MRRITASIAGRTIPRACPSNLPSKITATILVVITLFPTGLLADEIHPFNLTNTSPVILVQGLPTARDPRLAAPGDIKTNLVFEITSHYRSRQTSRESLLFDGETLRTTLSMKTGLTEDMDFEIQLPYVSHGGGFLDSFIIDWHRLFGFPQNRRDQVPVNQLQYTYQKDGVTLLNLQQPAHGLGDAQAILGIKLNRQLSSRQNNLAVKAAIKFPSGSSTKLTGNGAYAVSAWLTGDFKTDWFGRRGLTYINLGAMWLQQGDVLPTQQRSRVWFGGIGSGVTVSEHIVLQAQLDIHSQFYRDSGLVEIDSYAAQLTVGGNIKLSEGWNLDIGVAEDLIVHASPDVVFHLGLNGRF
jgi:hypothetical protein